MDDRKRKGNDDIFLENNGGKKQFISSYFGQTSSKFSNKHSPPDRNGWIIFDAKESKEPLEVWLENNKPSHISRNDRVAWISVKSKLDDFEPGDLMGLKEKWDDLVMNNANITYETLCKLAEDYKVTDGKWLLYVNSGSEVDQAWKTIATQIVMGKLGEVAMSAKVSPVNPSYKRNEHVICIYNRNFISEAEVLTVEEEIRKAGIKQPLKYKPDIYTYCNIYMNNSWNLRPTIYSSDYNVATCSSEIENLQTGKKVFVKGSKETSQKRIQDWFSSSKK